ncbi:dTDP-4-amino-4,6-dideoxygalactose transaminase [Methylomagnum ishizawai]|uniref:dTDP-4-amino-4,6-dideoxygalactose transaminase n=1 Tax=Methylomagnum ishizawai TaxID=1760988 RepID=A0A1Y6DBN0_9GAMM|nr:DegT/DnrJ/EryC1/StrS family aminotransferase [Methylomagnum ishizawai]SMF97662.1 dTDP-4-amino-4,6-dideoxygalactose transaminase [Methylomagnum ishizawai]
MIPFLDLKTQYHSIQNDIQAAVLATLDSAQYTLGRDVACFEEEFAAYCGATFGVAVNSGTSALHLALLAAGVGPGDEVVTVACTFVATVAAIEYAGATPVFVDVDPLTQNMDPQRIEAVLTDSTKAILPVHLHGQPADMDPILAIARRRGLVVIEDAAQAHGAEYKGRRVGALGDLGCFSFYPGKNLGAYGEAGMVVTDNEDYAQTLRMLRDWGQEHKYRHVIKGFNYRMEGLQGAVLRVKLRHLDDWTAARRQWAALYGQWLGDCPVETPALTPWGRSVHHVYAIRSPRRDKLLKALQQREIQTGIHYPVPVHLQPAYSNLGYQAGDLPTTERIAQETLSLPMFPELGTARVEAVAAAVWEALAHG